jgi:hypothetical protein
LETAFSKKIRRHGNLKIRTTSSVRVREACFAVCAAQPEEWAWPWEAALVKAARGWESVEESVKVGEVREVAMERAARGLAVAARDRRERKLSLNRTPLERIVA